MSFAKKVKEELASQIGEGRHCQAAELAALWDGVDRSPENSHGDFIPEIYTESLTVSEKCIILYKYVFRKDIVCIPEKHGKHLKVDPSFFETFRKRLNEVYAFGKSCCKRAYLRGWFLAAGTVADPTGQYHLEIDTMSLEKAEYLRKLMRDFGLEAKITSRKGSNVVYLKEGQRVVDFLNVVGAHVALMEFENARVLKEVRGNINRRVNLETANIKKAVSASAKQIEDIKYIRDTVGFSGLSENLSSIAEVRLANPEVTLKELGEMLDPPVGKSGVNHRLRRLGEIAAALREESG